MIERPISGFHFLVKFDLENLRDIDLRFQEVAGLTVTVETEEFKEGGENRFSHKLPKRSSYASLELKRGKFVHSTIIEWCRDGIENFDFKPVNLTVVLLNDAHLPLAGWKVIHAYPIEWGISGFNAQSSDLVVESLKLNYSYFEPITLTDIV